MPEREIRIYEDLSELTQAAADRFVEAAHGGIEAKGFFTISLAGGSTPRSLYTRLSSSDYRARVDWTRVHFFWGDERIVPSTHPDSNYRMANETLLKNIPISEDHLHRIPTELTPASQAAETYSNELKNFFGLKEQQWPRFDLILLGMGPDGHTASLFPGSTTLFEKDRLVDSPYVEKFHSYRITLTPPTLNQAAGVLFFVAGGEKAQAVREVLEGNYDPARYPSQIIQPVDGALTWMLDRQAARLLSSRWPNTKNPQSLDPLKRP